MSANLRFIPNTAQTHSHKLPTERISDRLTEACLADTGRPEKTKNRAVSLRVQFADGEIFDQSPFYFFKIVMIAIEDLLGLVEIEIILAQFRPRQLCDRFDIAHDHGILRAGRWDNLEPPQLPIGLCEHFFRRFCLLESLPQSLDLIGRAGLLAQLALDGFHLFAQLGASLRLGKLPLHVLLQLLLNLRYI